MLKFSRADTGTIVALQQQRLPFIDELFELFGRREVDLVDYREGGNIALADLFEDVVRTVSFVPPCR